jgi:hypothetical protein
MRRVTAVLSVAAVVLWAAAAFAQGKDFSGKWAPDAEKNAAAAGAAAGGGGGGRGGGRGGGGPMTITQDAKTLTIEREGQNGTTKTVYNLDGSPSKNTGRGGEVESMAKWDGAKLVITTKGANGDTVSSWYMEGANLVQETTTPNGPRKVYYKKG